MKIRTPLEKYDQEDPPAGTPEWFVTYADLMTLLLAMFALLLSVSEFKTDASFQSLAGAVEKQFAWNMRGSANASLAAPRDPAHAQRFEAGRARRREELRDREPMIEPSVSLRVRPDSLDFSSEDLRSLRSYLKGREQDLGPIEIHVSADDTEDAAALSRRFAYAAAAAQLLESEFGIEPRRFRILTAIDSRTKISPQPRVDLYFERVGSSALSIGRSSIP